MQLTGKSEALYDSFGDVGGLLVENEFYAASMILNGWRIVKFNAVSWEKLVDTEFSLDLDNEMNGNMMLAFVNGQLDISSQCLISGEIAPPQMGASTFHEYFTPDLEFLEERILDDTLHITGSTMLYIDGIYYFISATAYTGDILVMMYENNWNYLGMKNLIRQEHWSEGVAFDGQRFYLTYLETRWRTKPQFLPYYPNVHLVAFDNEWNLLEYIAVTDYSHMDSLSKGRPSLLMPENRIYVSYDVVLLPENLDNIEGFVSIYKLILNRKYPIGLDYRLKKNLLSQNFPNPFSSESVISYDLSSASHVTLNLYN